jgi:SAM-dependent methyltransferase
VKSPTIAEQQQFWDDWNRSWRFRGDLDYFMHRQQQVALDTARRVQLQNGKILDVGCGTGWLGNALTEFGRVTGTDLSPESIREGQKRHPAVELLAGDFLTLGLQGPFDFIVSADALAHFYDQSAFMARVAELLRPGGTFLLMTQNQFVWDRRSKYKTAGDGYIQRWPSLPQLRSMLAPRFSIEFESSLVPGGDQGVLWWVENRYVRGIIGRLIGRKRWESLLESAKLGRELVVVARKR